MKTDEIVNQIVGIELFDAHPANYNTHPPEQIERLRASLREFGQVESVAAQALDNGRFLMCAGHGVLEAARLEGFTVLRTDVMPSSWPQQRVMAYVAAANEHARQSVPVLPQLASLLVEVRNYDEALLLATGMDDLDVDVLLDQVGGMLLTLAESQPGDSNRDLGKKDQTVKVVLYTEQLAVMEQAIAATGLMNRGEAVTLICEAYLNGKGETTERQFDLDAEDLFANIDVGTA